MTPLNPQLFNALSRKFKNGGGILVANEGVQNVWRSVVKEGKIRRELATSGEQYRVCCPNCNDTRHRLYVNYEFGTADMYGQPNLHLIKCFNEDCFYADYERKQLFFHEVLFGRPIHKTSLQPGIVRPSGEYIAPGYTIPINQLDATHPAILYLQNRGFDINVLDKVYKVTWCVSSTHRFAPLVQSRIVIPIIEYGKEIGWLARIPQDGDFINSNGQKIPKYFNMPGLKTQRLLFNYDQAQHFKTIILVEGTLDCIKVGAPAMALFGKSVSAYNVERLASLANKNDATIVVALDPDKPIDDRSSKHHIEVAVDKLRLHCPKVMAFYLPSGTDPAALSREHFQSLLYSAAQAANITLDFSKTA